MLRRSLMIMAAVFALGVASVPSEASANGGPMNRTFGLGLQLGAPLGITGKVFLGEIPALQFGVGFILPYAGVGGWFDVVFHFVKIPNRREDVLTLHLYAGPGVQVGASGPYYGAIVVGRNYRGEQYTYFGGPPSIGIRAPFGFTIHWQKAAFDTFVEVSPVVYVYPGVFVVGEGAIGGRYYF